MSTDHPAIVSIADAAFEAEIDALIATIAAAQKADRVAAEAAERAADADALTSLGPLPVRVRIQQHETDTYRPCDSGREGWVRTVLCPSVSGAVTYLYVEDMSPGDDGNPTRYHFPRHVVRIEG